MKYIRVLAVLTIIILFISGCTNPSNTGTQEKIAPPQNQLIPIKGTWEISKILMTSSSKEDKDYNEWLGKRAQFSNSYMSLGETILESPRYQMKRVNKEDYLMFNSRLESSGLELPNKEVDIITVIDEDKFFCEVLIVKEDELVLKTQGNSFYLNKISNEVDEYTFSESNYKDEEEIKTKIEKEDLVNTGVLIGLRSPSKIEGEYNYRTLWISSLNNEVNPILEIENILFPRRSGFWKMEVKESKKDNKIEQYIVANNISMEEKKAEVQLESKIMRSEGLPVKEEDKEQELDFLRWGEKTGEIKRKINYIGNDYISVETIGKGEYTIGNEKWEKSKLELLNVDGLPNAQAVKISDILDEAGVASMKSAWEREINHLEIDNPSVLYREEMLENFGLARKLGHWFFKGRINYIKDKQFNVANYNIRLMPPSKVVFYDTLFVPWTNIKDREPRALDAYTSPNKDIAIVATKKEILIYDIHGNILSNYPKERIKLKEGEIIIMAEWATGQYVDSWENTFKNSGGQALKQ